MPSKPIRYGLAALLCGVGLACAAQTIAFPRAGGSLERAGGAAVPIVLEIAADDPSRERGLMGRTELADGAGMLFVFEVDRTLSFWMKNTLIPLSIAFLASDGRIIEFRDLRPLSLQSVQSSRSVRFALEVPQGWFARAGIAVGDRLAVPGYIPAK